MAVKPMRSFNTPGFNGYSVKFSAFTSDLLVVASSKNFGVHGILNPYSLNDDFAFFDGGKGYVMDLGHFGDNYSGSGGTGAVYVFDVYNLASPMVGCAAWTEGLYDVTWSEVDEKSFVTASADGSLQLWSLDDLSKPDKVYQEHTREVNSVEWCITRASLHFLSSSWDRTIKQWDPNLSEAVSTFSGHNGIVYQVSWCPLSAGLFGSVSADGTFCLWDLRKPSCVLAFGVHNADVLSLDWCKYNQYTVATAGVDAVVREWDIRQPVQPLGQHRGHSHAIRRVKYSPYKETKLASVSYDFTSRIWDNKLSCPCTELAESHTEFVYGLDMSNHVMNLVADCSWDCTVNVYEFNSLQYDF